jgi:hypothetical protein
MEAVHTSETSVDNHFTRQYIPEDNSEQDRYYKPINQKGPTNMFYLNESNVGMSLL